MLKHGFVYRYGFTILEFLISLTIVGIISSIAIASGKDMIYSFRGHGAANTLRHTLKFARSEAVTRNTLIRVCASSDGQYCSGSKKWEDGWITYMDLAGKTFRTDKDPILRNQPALSNLIIRKNGREKTVKFNDVGWIGLNRSFSICRSGDLKPIVRIVLVHSGRLRTDKKRIKCS